MLNKGKKKKPNKQDDCLGPQLSSSVNPIQ